MAHPKIQEMLDLAQSDVRRLRNAKSSAKARAAWDAFLEHSNRAINRLEQYARETGQTAKYKSLISKEVWESDLTRFIRSARNNHEHGIEDTVISLRFADRIIWPDGQIIGSPTIYGVDAKGERFVAGEQAGPTEIIGESKNARRVVLRPGVKMVPITSKDGEILPPPVKIEAEDEPEVAAAARLYLSWVSEKISAFT